MRCSAMPKERAENQLVAWWLIVEGIGRGLRQRYDVPPELPWTQSKGDYLMRYPGTTPNTALTADLKSETPSAMGPYALEGRGGVFPSSSSV